MKSYYSIILITTVWFILGTFYYPKWNLPRSEATISWDVAGYYHYLPAIFIYKDVRKQLWLEEIHQKYNPSPAYDQAFDHLPSGNKVNKFAIGQAVLYSPFFILGHAYATLSGSYPADGYSKPYQMAIWFGGFLFSILGLLLLRKILMLFFTDPVVAWTLLALGLGTHWMEYASITNGMNHTWLFTLLCILILSTIRFYKEADWMAVLGIGVSLGLAVLTRPTEVVWVFIPLLWGLGAWRERIAFLKAHWRKCILAIILCGLLISIQFIYWKYAAEEWIVYTYGDQGFNWIQPKVWRGLMGVKLGWFIYTPLMLLAMFGWYGLYRKNKPVFLATFIPSLLAIYITLSWPYFEFGGGLGQRNLIQIYPLMAFPMATVIAWFCQRRTGIWIWIFILAFNIYYNGWWIYQAHSGGFFVPGQMTTPYFYNVVARWKPNRDYMKLLDTREYFKGEPRQAHELYTNDFESDSLLCVETWPPGGSATCLNSDHQFIGPIEIPFSPECTEWIRVEGDFIIQSREWDQWKFTQWVVQFFRGEEAIKTNWILLQRLIPEDHIPKHLFFDVRIPDESYDRWTMKLWNANSPQTVLVDNLRISCFGE